MDFRVRVLEGTKYWTRVQTWQKKLKRVHGLCGNLGKAKCSECSEFSEPPPNKPDEVESSFTCLDTTSKDLRHPRGKNEKSLLRRPSAYLRSTTASSTPAIALPMVEPDSTTRRNDQSPELRVQGHQPSTCP